MLAGIAFAAIVISQSGWQLGKWQETRGRSEFGIPEVGIHPAAAEDIHPAAAEDIRPVVEDIQAHQQSAGGIEDQELRSIPDQT